MPRLTLHRMLPLAMGVLIPIVALALPPRVKPSPAQRARPAPGTVVIYRCTNASGMLSIQNGIPCPKGQKQSREVLQAPASTPATLPGAPVPVRPTTPAMPVAAPAMVPVPVVAAPLPPPALFRCHAYNNTSYLSDNGQPKSRCVPLQASTGTDAPGAPTVCERQDDTCERIPDQELCTAWTQYDREAQALVEMGNPDIADEAARLHARTRKVMTESSCAAAPAQNP